MPPEAAALPEAAKTIKPGLTVSRLKGRPFYGQAMGQLRLTCTFSAECAQRVEMHPFCLRHLPRRGRFALRSASELISTSMHSTAKSSPLRGKGGTEGTKRGAFPSRHRRGRRVFPLLLPNMQIISPAQHQKGPLPQAAFITPSEPARSAGGTHRSARSARTIEPGRRRRLTPLVSGNTAPRR